MDRSEIANHILRQRKWERSNLPLPGSRVAVEIVFYLLANSERSVTRVKDIHLELGYSEDRVGVVVKNLAAGGFLVIETELCDNRARNVRAASGLHELCDKYIEELVVLG